MWTGSAVPPLKRAPQPRPHGAGGGGVGGGGGHPQQPLLPGQGHHHGHPPVHPLPPTNSSSPRGVSPSRPPNRKDGIPEGALRHHPHSNHNHAPQYHHYPHGMVVPGGPGSGSSAGSVGSTSSSMSSASRQRSVPPQPGPEMGLAPGHHPVRRSASSGAGIEKRMFPEAADMVVIDYVDGGCVAPSMSHLGHGLQPMLIQGSGPRPPSRPPTHLRDIHSTSEVTIAHSRMINLPQPQQHHPQQPQMLVQQGKVAKTAGYQSHQFHHYVHQHQHIDGNFHLSSGHAYLQQQQQHFQHAPQHHAAHQQHSVAFVKNSNRSSRSSDTSSAYSGSDTMQSIQSSLENDPVDLSGLHESVVDSDEDLADSIDSLAIRDIVRDCLEKDPADRTPEDIDTLLEFTQTLPAFNNMTLATRRALCSVMVFAVVEKAGTIVMNDSEELDSWSVIINGDVRIDDPNGSGEAPRMLRWGDSFGITPTMEKLYHRGVMRTCSDECQFVCITQTDYYKILNEGESNQKRYEENGTTVLVTEPDASGKVGHKVIRGTPERLLYQLIDENSTADPTYVEDFLLTHRTFMSSSLEVAERLLSWFHEGDYCDKVTRVLLLWVHNHFTDFEMDPQMMEFLERFEIALEANKKNGQLRMLNFACAEKARRRVLTVTRPSREEPLQFSLMGGYERGFGVFVDRVEKASKAAEAGLKRGDQILEVNGQSFEMNMSLQRALTLLRGSTHLEITVKSNLLAPGDEGRYKGAVEAVKEKSKSKKGSIKIHSLMFKDMLQTPENSPRTRLRKASDASGLRSSSTDYADGSKGHKMSESGSSSVSLRSNSSSSSLPVNAMTGKEKVKAVLRNLIRPRTMSYMTSLMLGDLNDVPAGLTDHTNAPWEQQLASSDQPEHSLKIFRSDQHFRYLLVHAHTSAQQVVMLALREFGITDCSQFYTLCEVTVEGGFVKQKRLSDHQTNLAERIGLASRYYVKNTNSSEQLIPEDAKTELVKESVVNLLQLNPIETATQLMVEDFTVFRTIEPTEYIDKLFELESKFGTPNLTKFGELVNTEMMWVITEIVSEHNVTKRAKIIKQFIKIAHHCYKETQNFNSMFAIISGLDHGAVTRLKATWEKVSPKYVKLLNEMQIMDPSMNFRKYRNLIANSKPPIIPIYPMVNKDLTFIHLGNETTVEHLINFEKLRMLAKEVRTLLNMCSTPLDLFTMLERQGSDFSEAMRKLNPPTHLATMRRGVSKKNKDALNAKKMYEEAQMVRRVKTYLSRMPVIKDEEVLHAMSLEVEPQPATSQQPLPMAPPAPVANNSSQPTPASARSQLSARTSTASLSSVGSKGRPRGHSPTPSMASTNSSTSHQSLTSDGRKHSSSGANSGTKFGTDSPQAVRKLMSLSESSRTRPKSSVAGPQQPKTSVSSLQSASSPPHSPTNSRKAKSTHERSHSDCGKINLTAESSSVTSLPALRKAGNSTASVTSQHESRSSKHSSKAKSGRTLSRDRRKHAERDADAIDEAQVSAV